MKGFYLLFGFKVLFLVSFLGEANIDGPKLESKNNTSVYIVYMGASLKNSPRNDHAQLMSHLLKRKKCVVQTYNQSFVGLAARLSEEEAKSIAQREGVLSVFPDRVSQLHTTRSWDFLMSQINNAAAFRKEYSSSTSSLSQVSCSAGADTIIGFIDSGIWPDHPSFNDNLMTQVPRNWKGICMPGENHTDPFVCTKKVIGARYYDDPDNPGFIVTARDEYGHGTHTASIAAGVPVQQEASYYGLASGTARGGSPRSRIVAYRPCSSKGCSNSGILKAFDDAIADGVDVISISISMSVPVDFLDDVIAIGSFHAVEKGVVVVASCGNGGPFPGTVRNVAPWILSVASTTMDRDFETDVVLGGGNTVVIKGGGTNLSNLRKSPVYRLVDGRTASSNQQDVFNASNCIPGSLDVGKVKGRIILCENRVHNYAMREKFDTLKRQLGVIGMIVIDNRFGHTSFAMGASPIAMVNENDGAQIRNYIKSARNPTATILPTAQVSQYKPAPVVSRFSARGPTPDNPNLIKPDIAAPGENILAARAPINNPNLVIPGKEPPLFYIDSGTSVACPHVSSLAANLKSNHPTWSPSAIKSAIMTTAISTNNSHSLITTYNGSTATPYELGSGEINLIGSLWPGLVYRMETDDYLMFLCNYGYNTSAVKTVASTLPNNFFCPSDSSHDLISDMNYPSIAVSGLKTNEVRTVRRTVTNVGEEYSTYHATVETPAGMQLQVVPNILRFTKAVKKQNFHVNLVVTNKNFNEPLFGSLTWSNGKNRVRSPAVVSNA